MRLIGTLPEESAERFTDYLTTLKIDTHLIAEGGGFGVWVRDEDRVVQAREELQQFLRAPTDSRYHLAAAAARALRRKEVIEDERYRQLQEEAQEKLTTPADEPGPKPATFLLIGLCLFVAIGTNMGSKTSSLTQSLLISTQMPGNGLGLIEVRSGQPWRLVSPVFLHFQIEGDPTGLMHLVFNMMLFLPLAGQIESRRGTRSFLLLFLAIAVLSNLVQYYLGGTTLEGLRPSWAGSSNFGGMSGVVYGLFGYIWIKSRTDSDLGLEIPPGTAVILIGWLVVGPMFDKDIASGAHVGGLAAGCLLAALPTLWRKPPAPEDGTGLDAE